MNFLKGLAIVLGIIVIMMVTMPFVFGIFFWVMDHSIGDVYFQYCVTIFSWFKGG